MPTASLLQAQRAGRLAQCARDHCLHLAPRFHLAAADAAAAAPLSLVTAARALATPSASGGPTPTATSARAAAPSVSSTADVDAALAKWLTLVAMLRDAQDLLGACVLSNCRATYDECMTSRCVSGTCALSAPPGAACAVHADCMATLRGASGPVPTARVDLADALWWPDQATSTSTPSSADEDRMALLGDILDTALLDEVQSNNVFTVAGTNATTTTTATVTATPNIWGNDSSLPFAALGFIPVRLSYCHARTKACRATAGLDAVIGARPNGRPAYDLASGSTPANASATTATTTTANATVVTPGVGSVGERAIVLRGVRCIDTAQCPVGVCADFAGQCLVDRPLYLMSQGTAKWAAVLSDGSGDDGVKWSPWVWVGIVAGALAAVAALVMTVRYWRLKSRRAAAAAPSVSDSASETNSKTDLDPSKMVDVRHLSIADSEVTRVNPSAPVDSTAPKSMAPSSTPIVAPLLVDAPSTPTSPTAASADTPIGFRRTRPPPIVTSPGSVASNSVLSPTLTDTSRVSYVADALRWSYMDAGASPRRSSLFLAADATRRGSDASDNLWRDVAFAAAGTRRPGSGLATSVVTVGSGTGGAGGKKELAVPGARMRRPSALGSVDEADAA
ncbi:hypothetical protein AMAG_04953 [Allomyces macrogynus ATCC 38327]|uniref:Uncharacterized protein n=1 Tax=Allomyces macrogynus (strain ATCC 38327) TaxID=578462 RepID=A0A0L0S6J8_ALLM3|nr:hypothetical protein AMAG_04953 [Allomyces macrogynus ATCC 38327]|eukprot:KNE58137.1 hypothetical protein AMAG_04953 [Allomyces macrogynus ATCC 38327]